MKLNVWTTFHLHWLHRVLKLKIWKYVAPTSVLIMNSVENSKPKKPSDAFCSDTAFWLKHLFILCMSHVIQLSSSLYKVIISCNESTTGISWEERKWVRESGKKVIVELHSKSWLPPFRFQNAKWVTALLFVKIIRNEVHSLLKRIHYKAFVY